MLHGVCACLCCLAVLPRNNITLMIRMQKLTEEKNRLKHRKTIVTVSKFPCCACTIEAFLDRASRRVDLNCVELLEMESKK